MGWLFYTDRRVSNYAEEKAEIMRICRHVGSEVKQEPIQMSKVGSTWYVAVRTTPIGDFKIKNTDFVLDENGSYVFAAVFLVRYDDGCFGYKDMDESMGPAEAKAPISLLDKLSKLATEDTYAHRWRRDCRAWAAIPSYNVGDVIKLAKPVNLTDGSKVEVVECTTYRRGRRNMRCYKDRRTGTLCRLSKPCLIGSELIETRSVGGTSVLDEFRARVAQG